jgi:hypothetical protein
MSEVCVAINRMLNFDKPPVPMSADEAGREWDESVAQNTMGSNSRVRAVRARKELGWCPHRPSLIEEIEQGCYAHASSRLAGRGKREEVEPPNADCFRPK